MRRPGHLGVGVGLVTLAIAASVQAALTPEQGKCQRALATAGEVYVKHTMAALASCEDSVSAGRLSPGTICRSYPETAAKLANASAQLAKKLERTCGDGVVTSLRFGAACEGASTVTALTACIEADHAAHVDALIGALYATGGELSKVGQGCQRTASARTRVFAFKRLSLLRRCKNRAARGKLPVGTDCRDEPKTAAKLAKKKEQAAAKIQGDCGVQPLGEVGFGAPCAGAASGDALAACLLSLVDGTADALSLAQYGDGSFCGDSHQAVEGRVNALLAQMTLEEKVEQMHGLPGIMVPWPTPDNVRLDIPGFHMVDGPRGVSAFTGTATAFPVGMARGATWDPELEEQVGLAVGTEVRARGGTVLLAPVTTVVRHPRWGRSQESYGEDPLHIGSMGVGFVRGVQQRVIASAKHYAVNSIEDTRFTVNVSVDERTLREIYLPHFRRLVQVGDVASIMAAYNSVNGQYCAENEHLLRDILKGDWGFRGFVESDWFVGTRSTVASALNGLDIEMPGPVFYGPALVTAVGAGDVPEATIDEAVRRILRTKLCFRLDTDPPQPAENQIETPEHVTLALEVAREASVLLKNEGPVLPLDRGTLSSLAVVGPLGDVVNLGDAGSSSVVPSDAVTVLGGILDRAGAVAVTHIPDPNSAADQAAIAAAGAVVLVVGLTAADESEGQIGPGDRELYGLSAEQEQLILDVAGLNDAVIVVLEGGSSIGVESWIGDVEALLMAWYPGLQGGNAIADLLFGDVNPSGKLPLVWARSEGDLPPFINDQNEVTYDYYHGYRLLDRNAVDPRFPFGFGLSYTNYTYSSLSLDDSTLGPDETLRLSFDLTNTGAVAGNEVAQLYVSYVGPSVDRPVRDLKAFTRVHLEPNETRTVSLEVPIRDLAYYNVGASAWQVESITYGVHVGPSSRDLPLTTTFDVQ